MSKCGISSILLRELEAQKQRLSRTHWVALELSPDKTGFILIIWTEAERGQKWKILQAWEYPPLSCGPHGVFLSAQSLHSFLPSACWLIRLIQPWVSSDKLECVFYLPWPLFHLKIAFQLSPPTLCFLALEDSFKSNSSFYLVSFCFGKGLFIEKYNE